MLRKNLLCAYFGRALSKSLHKDKEWSCYTIRPPPCLPFDPDLLTSAPVSTLTAISLAAFGVLFIGLSKAGFGGGLGMLTTPLCVLAFSAQGKDATFAIGILLPLLCAGDAFSLYHYWGKWERKNLKYLLPGVVLGVLAGVQMVGRFSARELNEVIGLLAVLFVVFPLVKERVFFAEGAFAAHPSTRPPSGLGRVL